MPESIPWESAMRFADLHQLRQVVVVAWDGEKTHVVTFGQSVDDSDQAAEGGNRVKAALGWPETLRAESPKVAALRADIQQLTHERDELREYLTELWNASGLLCESMTGQPDQARKLPNDLIGQVQVLDTQSALWEEHEREHPEETGADAKV